MSAKYEAYIGSYSFIMTGDDTIEVWGNDTEYPEGFIYVSPGSVKSKKDFDFEISDYFLKNLQ